MNVGTRYAPLRGMTQQQAVVIEKNVGGSGRPILRMFYACMDGTQWAVLQEDERRARRALLDRAMVTVQISCPDDQFARLGTDPESR